MPRFTYSLHRVGFGVLLSLALVTAGVTNTAVAAETKKGTSKTVSNKLLQKIHGQYQGKLKEIAALAAAEEEKIRKVASKKEMLRLQQLAAESKKISDMPAGKSRASAIAAFNQKNRNFGRELEKRAGITIESRQRHFEKVFPKRSLRRVKGEALQSTAPYNIVGINGNADGSTTTIYEGDYPDIDTDTFPVEVSEGVCGNQPGGVFSGFYDLSVNSMALVVGGCSKMQLLGTYVTVPAHLSRVSYRLELNEGYRHSVYAFGFLGVGIAGATLGSIVQGPGVESTSVAESLFAIAPLAFVLELLKEQSVYVISGEFTPDRAGGEYLIGAYVEASALGIAGGGGLGTSSGQSVSRLVVEFH